MLSLHDVFDAVATGYSDCRRVPMSRLCAHLRGLAEVLAGRWDLGSYAGGAYFARDLLQTLPGDGNRRRRDFCESLALWYRCGMTARSLSADAFAQLALRTPSLNAGQLPIGACFVDVRDERVRFAGLFAAPLRMPVLTSIFMGSGANFDAPADLLMSSAFSEPEPPTEDSIKARFEASMQCFAWNVLTAIPTVPSSVGWFDSWTAIVGDVDGLKVRA